MAARTPDPDVGVRRALAVLIVLSLAAAFAAAAFDPSVWRFL